MRILDSGQMTQKSQPGKVLVRRTRASSVDAHTEQFLDADLRYDQLDQGTFEGRFTDVRWPGLQLFVETTTRRVQQRGVLPPKTFGVGIMLSGDGALRVNGKSAGAQTLLAARSGEFDACTPANCTLIGLVVDVELFCNATRCVPELEPLLQGKTLLSMTASEAALAPLRSLLMSAVDLALNGPGTVLGPVVQQRLRDDLLVHMVEAMAGAQRSDDVAGADARKRIVDRACELMLLRPDEPPTLLDICNRVGASPRKLSYCFHDVLGLSPGRYLKAVRLNAVRRELRRCADMTTSVYDVASRWGFWHFGNFSGDYKKQFAELPSETLRRAWSGSSIGVNGLDACLDTEGCAAS